MNTHNVINVNTASADELIAVPGIGPALAQLIIENRPYQEVDDLRRISGIGKNSIKELRPYLVVETQELTTITPKISSSENFSTEDVPHLELEESDLLPDEENDVIRLGPAKIESEPDVNEATPVDEPLFYDIPEEKSSETDTTFKEVSGSEEKDRLTEKTMDAEEPEKATEVLPAYVTRQQLTWSVIAAVVGAVILTLALTLGILAFINGDLRYATWNDAMHLGNQITTLSDRSDTLQSDAEQMRKRIDAMETIAGRVTILEETTQTIQDDLSETQNQLQNAQEMITELQNNMTEIQQRIDQYNNAFLGIYNAVLPLVEPMLEGGQNK